MKITKQVKNLFIIILMLIRIMNYLAQAIQSDSNQNGDVKDLDL